LSATKTAAPILCAKCGEEITNNFATYDGVIYHLECGPAPRRIEVSFWLGNRKIYTGRYLNMRAAKRTQHYLETQHGQEIGVTVVKPLDGGPEP